jgi:hypothetical protein
MDFPWEKGGGGINRQNWYQRVFIIFKVGFPKLNKNFQLSVWSWTIVTVGLFAPLPGGVEESVAMLHDKAAVRQQRVAVG